MEGGGDVEDEDGNGEDLDVVDEVDDRGDGGSVGVAVLPAVTPTLPFWGLCPYRCLRFCFCFCSCC